MRAEAYKPLRAVLHTLRERLPLSETMQLNAQLPLLVSGLLFDGYAPGKKPVKYDSEEFLKRVAERLRSAAVPMPDPMRYTSAVIRALIRHLSPGQLDDLLAVLPQDLQRMFEQFRQDPVAESAGDGRSPQPAERRRGHRQ